MFAVFARLSDEVDDFLGALLRHRLPQTRHESADDGSRKRRSHIAHDDATAVHQPRGGSDGHDVGLDTLVLRGTDTTERGYLVGLAIHNGSDAHDVVGIGWHTDFLPCPHARIACRIDQYDTFRGQHRCRAADECRPAVELPQAIRHPQMVIFVVPQRRIDEVATHGVGKLGGHRPIVFLHLLLRLLVFRAQEPVAGLGSRAYIIIRYVDGHCRQHLRTVVDTVEQVGCLRIDEVATAANVHTLEGGNLVHVLESSVDDGNHHPFAAQTDAVQPLTLHRRNLPRSRAIDIAGRAVTFLELLVHLHLQRPCGHRVGRLPHQPAPFDAGQLAEAVNLRRVLDAHQHGVLPTALADDADILVFDEADIAATDGQIGGVHRQPLSSAPFHAASRQESGRVSQQVCRLLLVCQIESVDKPGCSLVFHAHSRLLVGIGMPRERYCQQKQNNQYGLIHNSSRFVFSDKSRRR